MIMLYLILIYLQKSQHLATSNKLKQIMAKFTATGQRYTNVMAHKYYDILFNNKTKNPKVIIQPAVMIIKLQFMTNT